MKLAFSIAKTAVPKRKVEIQLQDQESPEKREVIQVSNEDVVVAMNVNDQLKEQEVELEIPVKTLYVKPERRVTATDPVNSFSLQQYENRGGFVPIEREKRDGGDVVEANEPPRKKPIRSILMQIKEARESGKVKDAPESTARELDPDKFGWALLRGMGYDPTKDTSPDVTKTVKGNMTRLGLGVKLDPKDTSSSKSTQFIKQ
jgi:hypothetical protein